MKSTAQLTAFYRGRHRSLASLAATQVPIPNGQRSVEHVSKLFGSPDLGKRVMDENIALGRRLRGEKGEA